jgi:hypothetical protein
VLDTLADIVLGIAYTVSAMSSLPNVGLYGSVVPDLVIAASVIDMTLNVSVTVAIVGRLWRMGRKLASLTDTRANQNASSIYVIVESGAIFAAANIVMLALYALNSPALMAGLDVASQLAVCVRPSFLLIRALSCFTSFRQALTPLLIVVQVGLTGRYHIPSGDSSRTVLTLQEEITFRVGLPREDSLQDLSLHTLSRSPSSAHDAHV